MPMVSLEACLVRSSWPLFDMPCHLTQAAQVADKHAPIETSTKAGRLDFLWKYKALLQLHPMDVGPLAASCHVRNIDSV